MPFGTIRTNRVPPREYLEAWLAAGVRKELRAVRRRIQLGWSEPAVVFPLASTLRESWTSSPYGRSWHVDAELDREGTAGRHKLERFDPITGDLTWIRPDLIVHRPGHSRPRRSDNLLVVEFKISSNSGADRGKITRLSGAPHRYAYGVQLVLGVKGERPRWKWFVDGAAQSDTLVPIY